MRSKITYANVAATLAVVMATGGGAFAVGAVVDRNGNVQACYVKKGRNAGELRVLVKGTKCRRTETKLSWNQVGPRAAAGPNGAHGAPGAQGPQGPAGPAGPSGGTSSNASTLDNLDSTDFLRSNANAGGDLSGPFSNLQIGNGTITSAEVADGVNGLTGADIREDTLNVLNSQSVDSHSISMLFLEGDPGGLESTWTDYGALRVSAGCNATATPEVSVTVTSNVNDAIFSITDDDTSYTDPDFDIADGPVDVADLGIQDGKQATIVFHAPGGVPSVVDYVTSDSGIGRPGAACLALGHGVYGG